VALALIALSPLAPSFAGLLPACAFKRITGLPCPSCGATRSALALARFDFADAFVHYPLAALAWSLLIGGGLVAGVAALAGYGVPELPRRLPLWARVGIVLVVLANWLYLIATGV
jgi:hypothetical protein